MGSTWRSTAALRRSEITFLGTNAREADAGRPLRTRCAVVHPKEPGHLKPVIAKTLPLDQIVEARRYLQSNQQFGKIVVAL